MMRRMGSVFLEMSLLLLLLLLATAPAMGQSPTLLSLNQGTCTITDSDPTPTLSINDVTATEGNAGSLNALFTVNLSAASGQTVTVKFVTANGTAIAPNDYTTASGTLTFNPGQTSKAIAIQVKGDTLPEGNETFKVNLSAPTKATILDGQGIGTILNND